MRSLEPDISTGAGRLKAARMYWPAASLIDITTHYICVVNRHMPDQVYERDPATGRWSYADQRTEREFPAGYQLSGLLTALAEHHAGELSLRPADAHEWASDAPAPAAPASSLSDEDRAVLDRLLANAGML